MKTGSITQTIQFKCSPEELYELFMDAKKHETITGSEVIMSTEIGGEFQVFDGYCSGHNTELIPRKKIVQEWYFAEEGWPEDHFSTCTFLFEQVGENTLLHFTQTGIPEHKVSALTDGWNEYYWDPMTELLEGA